MGCTALWHTGPPHLISARLCSEAGATWNCSASAGDLCVSGPPCRPQLCDFGQMPSLSRMSLPHLQMGGSAKWALRSVPWWIMTISSVITEVYSCHIFVFMLLFGFSCDLFDARSLVRQMTSNHFIPSIIPIAALGKRCLPSKAVSRNALQQNACSVCTSSLLVPWERALPWPGRPV